MSLRDLLTRETVQMTLVIAVTLCVHYFFIRNRFFAATLPPPDSPVLEMPPTEDEDNIYHGFDDDAMLG